MIFTVSSFLQLPNAIRPIFLILLEIVRLVRFGMFVQAYPAISLIEYVILLYFTEVDVVKDTFEESSFTIAAVFAEALSS